MSSMTQLTSSWSKDFDRTTTTVPIESRPGEFGVGPDDIALRTTER